MRYLGNEVPHGPSLEPSAPKLYPILQFGKIIEKKIKLKHQKTISIGEEKHLAISNLSSNAV